VILSSLFLEYTLEGGQNRPLFEGSRQKSGLKNKRKIADVEGLAEGLDVEAFLLGEIPEQYVLYETFPVAADLHSSLLPGEELLLGHNASPLVIRHGQVSGDPDLVLHPPRLTDPLW
jgi:hypothetical protein